MQSGINLPNFQRNILISRRGRSFETLVNFYQDSGNYIPVKEKKAGFEEMHNDEFQDSYFLPHIRPYVIIVWVRHITCMGEMRNVHTFLVAKSE